MDNNMIALVRFLPLLIGLLAAASVLARGCTKGPFGRSQIVTLTTAEENSLGLQSYRQILSKNRILRDEPVVDSVRRVGRRLAEASLDAGVLKALKLPERRFDWEFNVVDSPQINAFCLPGGKVAMYTGILPVCKTETGLAVVMGHEIGHALARHGAERMAQNDLLRAGQMAVAGSLGGLDYGTQRMVIGMMGAGAQYGVLLPFSRSHESEADRIGLILMAKAGYNPREGPAFWERMNRATGSRKTPEFASTHPSPETRIRDLTNWADREAFAVYRKSDALPDQPLPPVRSSSR
jgi:metalloendopeptidase OMA1, mitochondrial